MNKIINELLNEHISYKRAAKERADELLLNRQNIAET